MDFDGQDPSRRAFLKRSIFLLGGLVTAALAIPSGVYFLSPLWKRRDESWIDIAPLEDIPIGEPIKIDFIQRKKDGWRTIEGRSSVWVVTADRQQFTVYDPQCTHLGCPYRWDRSKQQFLCPCHNAAFAIDGEVLTGPPPRPLDRLPTKVVGDRLLIQIRPRQVAG